MPRVQSTSATGVVASAPLLLDMASVGPLPGVFLTVGAGCTVSVEVTADDVENSAVTPVWVACGVAALTGAVASAAAGLTFPARAVRLNQTAGANTSTMKLVEKGIR